jgi:hypothetical protein
MIKKIDLITNFVSYVNQSISYNSKETIRNSLILKKWYEII